VGRPAFHSSLSIQCARHVMSVIHGFCCMIRRGQRSDEWRAIAFTREERESGIHTHLQCDDTCALRVLNKAALGVMSLDSPWHIA